MIPIAHQYAYQASSIVGEDFSENSRTTFQSSSTIGDERQENNSLLWRQIIDEKLMSWFKCPSQIEDIDVDAPTRTVIKLAINLAQKLYESGIAPPGSVVPDPNGGIVFERQNGRNSSVYHIWDDESIEYILFQDTKIIERYSISDPRSNAEIRSGFDLDASTQTQALTKPRIRTGVQYAASNLAASIVLATGATFYQ